MTVRPPHDAGPSRVLVSGATHLLPQIDALLSSGMEVIASDRDASSLAAAACGRARLRCLPADLDLKLDAHRLAVAARRAGCDALVHHMSDTGGYLPPEAAVGAFLRAMRLIHAMRPTIPGRDGGVLVLTGCPVGCARSLRIVLDRAGTFCARTGIAIVQCDPDAVPAEVIGRLTARRAILASGPTGDASDVVALAS